MYPHNIYQNRKNIDPNKGASAGVRIRVLLHVPVIIVIHFLTVFFSETALQICRPGIAAVTLYICMDLCSLLAVIYLYSKYILKTSFAEMYLAKPFPSLKWCMASAVLPAASDLFYLIFVKGDLQYGGFAQNGFFTILYTDIFSRGLRIALSEGLLFRGFALHIFQKSFHKKQAALLSGILYACIPVIPIDGSSWFFDGILQQTAAVFLTGYALSLITLNTGSIWSSVVIHAACNILSGDSHIIHISMEQPYPALWTYTLENDDRLTAGIPSVDCIYTALPSMLIFVLIILYLFFTKRRPYGTLPDTDCRR